MAGLETAAGGAALRHNASNVFSRVMLLSHCLPDQCGGSESSGDSAAGSAPRMRRSDNEQADCRFQPRLAHDMPLQEPLGSSTLVSDDPWPMACRNRPSRQQHGQSAAHSYLVALCSQAPCQQGQPSSIPWRLRGRHRPSTTQLAASHFPGVEEGSTAQELPPFAAGRGCFCSVMHPSFSLV